LHEPRNGLSVARNTGIENCSGNIIVFIDDDFIVEKDFLANLLRSYDSRDVGSCTGRMLSYRDDELSRVFEKHMSYDRGEVELRVTARDMNFRTLFKTALSKALGKRRSVPPYNVGFGFGSFRREVFCRVGEFDTNLGRGTPQMGSDDVDIYYRALRTGYTIVYQPSAVIRHNHRHTTSELIEYAYSSGVSIASFTKKYMKEPYVLALFIANVILTNFALMKAAIKSDPKLEAIWCAQLRGYFRIFQVSPSRNRFLMWD